MELVGGGVHARGNGELGARARVHEPDLEPLAGLVAVVGGDQTGGGRSRRSAAAAAIAIPDPRASSRRRHTSMFALPVRSPACHANRTRSADPRAKNMPRCSTSRRRRPGSRGRRHRPTTTNLSGVTATSAMPGQAKPGFGRALAAIMASLGSTHRARQPIWHGVRGLGFQWMATASRMRPLRPWITSSQSPCARPCSLAASIACFWVGTCLPACRPRA